MKKIIPVHEANGTLTRDVVETAPNLDGLDYAHAVDALRAATPNFVVVGEVSVEKPMVEIPDHIRMQAAARGLTPTDDGQWIDKDGAIFSAFEDEAQALLGTSKVTPMVAFIRVSATTAES